MDKTDTAAGSCPCHRLLPKHIQTNHSDDAIVFDVATEFKHRCRLCGRRFTLWMMPGDALLGNNAASEGYDGHPVLSFSAARRGDYDERPDDGGEWKPSPDEPEEADAPRLTPFEQLVRLAGESGSLTREQIDQMTALLAMRVRTD